MRHLASAALWLVAGLALALLAGRGPTFAQSPTGDVSTTQTNRGPIAMAETTIVQNGRDPVVAYNSTQNEYLVVWTKDVYENTGAVYGQRVDAQGTLLGGPFIINQVEAGSGAETPAVAYNRAANEYLVVWVKWQDFMEPHIYGQRVAGNGTRLGSSIFISHRADGARQGLKPAVDYSTTTDRYVVVWYMNQEIRGRRVQSDGSLPADWYVIGPATTPGPHQSQPGIALSSHSNDGLVTWHTTTAIYGQRVLTAGGTIGDRITIAEETVSTRTDVTYSDTADEYVVVWDRDEGGYVTRVWGRRLAYDGSLVGSTFPVSPAPNPTFGGRYWHPLIAFNSTSRNYLAPFIYTFGPEQVMIQYLNLQGGLLGEMLTEVYHPCYEQGPYWLGLSDVVANPNANNWLLVYLVPECNPEGKNDSTMQEPPYTVRVRITRDTTPPTIHNIAQSTDWVHAPGCPEPTGVTINARITDPSGVAWVNLRWETARDAGTIPMTLVYEDIYSVRLTSFDFTLPGMSYQVLARDNAGNETPVGPADGEVWFYDCALDQFEPDDTCAQATEYNLYGMPQSHDFFWSTEDVDWVKFTAVAGTYYVIETGYFWGANPDWHWPPGRNVDTVIFLYRPDCTTLIAEDDDGGEGLYSRIGWVADASGTFYVKVQPYSSMRTGAGSNYDLWIATVTEFTLQNGLNGYAGAVDTWMDDARPTTNFNSGSEANFLRVYADGHQNTLIRFDVSSIPDNATVLEARLELMITARSNTNRLVADAYELRRSWHPSEATWLKADASTPWQMSGAAGPDDRSNVPSGVLDFNAGAGTWVTADLTQLVQSWVGWVWWPAPANHGVILVGRSGGGVQYTACSSDYLETWRRPRLVVRYRGGPPLPPTPTPTFTSTPTSTGTWTPTATTTQTGTPTHTSTATATRTATPSVTPTLKPTKTPSATYSPTPSPTPTPEHVAWLPLVIKR